jgi:hypothetical protein
MSKRERESVRENERERKGGSRESGVGIGASIRVEERKGEGQSERVSECAKREKRRKERRGGVDSDNTVPLKEAGSFRSFGSLTVVPPPPTLSFHSPRLFFFDSPPLPHSPSFLPFLFFLFFLASTT